ncbi:MAG: hypothetical protein HPY76_00600 [Anaerolineae bacterium]|nr:hypothetical protein [Anaerolineae bacterium]
MDKNGEAEAIPPEDPLSFAKPPQPRPVGGMYRPSSFRFFAYIFRVTFWYRLLQAMQLLSSAVVEDIIHHNEEKAKWFIGGYARDCFELSGRRDAPHWNVAGFQSFGSRQPNQVVKFRWHPFWNYGSG